jgi:tRNA(fMet)-specific endonuclease VapC
VYLLDTNVLSEFARRRPNPNVVARARAIAATRLMTSSICVMELRHGAMLRPDGPTFWARLVEEVVSRVRVVPFDATAAERAGDILAALERLGQPIGIEDAQIAATAMASGLVVVTASARHFCRVPGLAHEDWTRSPEEPGEPGG